MFGVVFGSKCYALLDSKVGFLELVRVGKVVCWGVEMKVIVGGE